MKKRKADKPVKIKRKGEGDMAPATAIRKKTINKPITEKEIKNAGRISPAVKEATTFERRLIQKCKNDGMTDKEIREWMREI